VTLKSPGTHSPAVGSRLDPCLPALDGDRSGLLDLVARQHGLYIPGRQPTRGGAGLSIRIALSDGPEIRPLFIG
jgi:hypothetical protein